MGKIPKRMEKILVIEQPFGKVKVDSQKLNDTDLSIAKRNNSEQGMVHLILGNVWLDNFSKKMDSWTDVLGETDVTSTMVISNEELFTTAVKGIAERRNYAEVLREEIRTVLFHLKGVLTWSWIISTMRKEMQPMCKRTRLDYVAKYCRFQRSI